MRTTAFAAGLSTLALAALAAGAHAQPEPPVTTDDIGEEGDALRSVETMGGSAGDIRDNLNDWAVGPPGWDVGGELVFITSDVGFSEGRRLKMTDVGILRARARLTVSRRIELSGSVDALAKQPAYSEALPFQGASATLKIAVTRKWALASTFSGGPTLDDPTTGDPGWWGSGATAMIYRSHPDETLSFQLHLGAQATALRTDAMDPWLTEATAGGRIMLHAPNGIFGTWAGASLAVPVVHDGPIDPATRLDVSLGAAYALVRDWDLYVEGSILDRGDVGMPATMLPILDGGYDQKQLMIGVARRFAGKERHDRDAMMLSSN